MNPTILLQSPRRLFTPPSLVFFCDSWQCPAAITLITEGRAPLAAILTMNPRPLTLQHRLSAQCPNSHPTAQRPTAGLSYPYSSYPPAQQQETHAFHATSYSYQQRSEAGGQTHGQTYGASHNRASRSPSLANPWQSPTLGVPRGRRQGPPYDQPRPTTLRSSHTVQRSHVWSISSPYPPAANSAYPAGQRPYRGYDPAIAATNTHYQRPLDASLNTISNSQGNAQLPYGRDPSTLSSVPVGVLPETSGPSIKNREAHDTKDDCTSSSPTEEASEEHSEIEYGAKLNIPGFGAWFQHKKQSSHSSKRDSAKSEPRSGSK